MLERARRGLQRLDAVTAFRALQEGALLVDTRCAEQRAATGVIPGAVHVPLSVLYWRLDPASASSDPTLADTSRRIVLICAHGYSSSLAAATLQQLGFDRATDVDGGFEAWASAGLPVVPAGSDRDPRSAVSSAQPR